MQRGHTWRIGWLVALLVGSFVIYVYVANGSFSPCPVGVFTDEQKRTIASLDSIIDLSLKLSTTLVGFGAAALVGLKSGLKLFPAVKLSVAVATILFTQSALYAVWWRLGIADIFFNECFKIVASPKLQLRFEWHIYFFMMGLAAIAVLVMEALFRVPEKDADT